MLPTTDAEFKIHDGNDTIENDYLNRVERAPDALLGSGSDGVFPAPTGAPAAAWGGGIILYAKRVAGVADGADWLIDDSFNWLSRMIFVLEFGAYNAANRLFGEGTENAAQPGYDYVRADATTGAFYSKASVAGSPPAGGTYRVLAANTYLYVDAAGDLYLRSAVGGGNTIYPFIMLMASDQFPVRV